MDAKNFASYMNMIPNISLMPAFFVPFSDAVMTRFVNPHSFLGTFLVHHLKSTVGSGIAGLATGYIAEKCYDYVEKNFFGIEYKKQESAKSKTVLFSTRFVAYTLTGGVLGLAIGIFIPSVAVSTGIAVGVASFVGSQLVMRLIVKISQIILVDIFGICFDNMQEYVFYMTMGLKDAAMCTYRSHLHYDYDRLIREAVKSRIKEIKPMSIECIMSQNNSFLSGIPCVNKDEFIGLCLDDKLYEKDGKELDRIADLLVNSIETIAKCQLDYYSKHQYDIDLIKEEVLKISEFFSILCLTVSGAVIKNDASLIEKYKYDGKFYDEVRNNFLTPNDTNSELRYLEISKEQGVIINKIYNKIRPLLKANKKPLLTRTLSVQNLRYNLI